MKVYQPKFTSEWIVFNGTRRSQAAEMVIPRGGKEGGPGNKHKSDQWLFVLTGKGQARLKGKTLALKARTLLLIKAGEEHEIRNTGSAPLRTLNFYAPPAFRPTGR